MKQLGEIADVVRGIAFPKEARTNTHEDGLVACLRTTNVQKTVEWADLWFVPYKYVRNEKQYLLAGDTLISTANSLELVGKVAHLHTLEQRATLGAFIAAIRPSAAVAPKYLYLALAAPSSQEQIRATASTTTNISNISVKKLLAMELHLPSLPTQHRIVAEIEEKLSRLDAAQAALLRAQANLKRYRLSVLNAAITGAYSEPVKSSNAYLLKLLATHKSEWRGRGKYKEPATPNVPKGAQLPSGWVWASLDQLLLHVTDGDHQAPPQTAQGIPFLVIGNVRRGKIDLSDTRFVSTDYFNQLDSARVPRKGDLLYTLVGSYGIPVPVDVDEAFCIQRHMGILRPHSLSPMAYLQLAMASDFVFRQATAVSTGTAQRTVPLAGLRRMAIPLPPPELQNQIVEDAERRLSLIDRTEQTLRTQLERAKRLRQSILQQAFSPKEH